MNIKSRLKTLVILCALILTATAIPAVAADGDIVYNKFMAHKDGVNIYKIKYRSEGLTVNGQMFLEWPSLDKNDKLPCVIFCHDGISGISKEHRYSAIRLTKAGYAVFCPSYRGEDGSEGEIEIAKGEVSDVENAIKMVKKLKQVDPDRIALVGASHGALICMLVASRVDSIKAVVSAYGVMDIYKWWDYLKKNNKLGKDKYTRQTYGDGPKDRPKSFAIRNAVSFAHRIKAPVLILQGAKDAVVPPDQARYMKKVLDEKNVENKMIIYPDCLHGFLIYVPYLKKGVEKEERLQTEQAWKEMLKFLKEKV